MLAGDLSCSLVKPVSANGSGLISEVQSYDSLGILFKAGEWLLLRALQMDTVFLGANIGIDSPPSSVNALVQIGLRSGTSEILEPESLLVTGLALGEEADAFVPVQRLAKYFCVVCGEVGVTD